MFSDKSNQYINNIPVPGISIELSSKLILCGLSKLISVKLNKYCMQQKINPNLCHYIPSVDVYFHSLSSLLQNKNIDALL